jgi:Ca2+-transporting ATPase
MVEQSSGVALMLVGGALCNDAVLEQTEKGFSAVGDPTEGALVVAAARTGLWKEKLEEGLPRTNELPFDSDRKRMTTIHSIEDLAEFPPALQELITAFKAEAGSNCIAITKGAVDGLLDISSAIWTDEHIVKMDEHWRQRIIQANNELAQKGMRVLGIAFRLCQDLQTQLDCKMVEQNLTFIGMFAMIDPARPEVKDAVAVAKEAGVRPIMITGDHPLTAYI